MSQHPFIIRTLLRRGSLHNNFCEDFFFVYDEHPQYFLAAVFDGCSSGTDSHLASTLLAKLIRHSCRQGILDPVVTPAEGMKTVLYQLVKQLNTLKHDFGLRLDELLSTIILMLVDKVSLQTAIISIGDGFIQLNGQAIVIDQENEPDYLAYYLNDLSDDESFEHWFENHQHKYFADSVKDISISSDGILSFTVLPGRDESELPTQAIDAVNYLTKDDYLLNNTAMLPRKCNILKHKHQLLNQDDLCIIRLIVKKGES